MTTTGCWFDGQGCCTEHAPDDDTAPCSPDYTLRPRPAHLRGCERCGQVENEKHLHGGLCLDCQWSDELETEPATTTPAPWGACVGCGRAWPTELCSRCDDTPALMKEDYRP